MLEVWKKWTDDSKKYQGWRNKDTWRVWMFISHNHSVIQHWIEEYYALKVMTQPELIGMSDPLNVEEELTNKLIAYHSKQPVSFFDIDWRAIAVMIIDGQEVTNE